MKFSPILFKFDSFGKLDATIRRWMVAELYLIIRFIKKLIFGRVVVQIYRWINIVKVFEENLEFLSRCQNIFDSIS